MTRTNVPLAPPLDGVDAATEVSPFDPDFIEIRKAVSGRQEALCALDSDRRLFLAPAWDGPLSALTKHELHARIEALGAHIGRLFTRPSVFGGWQAVTPPDLDRWVQARIACLTEFDAREES